MSNFGRSCSGFEIFSVYEKQVKCCMCRPHCTNVSEGVRHSNAGRKVIEKWLSI